MSLTKTKIDPLARRLLTFKRQSSSLDSDYNPVSTTYTTITTGYGDIQPWAHRGQTKDAYLVSSENIADVTHISFTESRVSGVKVKDFIFDDNNGDIVKYEIVFVHDWNLNAPQEFDLKIKKDFGECTGRFIALAG